MSVCLYILSHVRDATTSTQQQQQQQQGIKLDKQLDPSGRATEDTNINMYESTATTTTTIRQANPLAVPGSRWSRGRRPRDTKSSWCFVPPCGRLSSSLMRLHCTLPALTITTHHHFVSTLLALLLLLSRTSLGSCKASTTGDRPYTSILYTAVDGGKVALPCNIVPPSLDDHVVLILWYKDDDLEPIYTIDARKDNLEHARTLSSPKIAERVYFNQHNQPAFLQIDPVSMSDTGEYRCRVDFKKARTVNTVIQLRVIIPPDEPFISYKYVGRSQQHLKGLIGPFNEGDRLVLVCTTLGGKPRPTLTWWKDYTIIDDTFEYKSKDVTANELAISPLGRHHLLSILTCQAVNNNITIASSASITLDLNLKPLEVKIRQLTSHLLAGHEAQFECATLGSKPKAIVYWMFEGVRYETSNQGELHTISLISLPLGREHNGHILSCYAENPKIINSTLADHYVLNIQYVPEVSLRLGTANIQLESLQEGNDIFFECHVDANPMAPETIVWRFNSQVLEPRQGVIQTNYSLVLQNVRRHMSGDYACEASNRHGTATSNSIQLNIRYAPYCRFSSTLAYGLFLYESAELLCQVDSNPAPSAFQWRFERESELSAFEWSGVSSRLHYQPNSTQHYGVIECIAKNDVGLQRQACRYHIIDSGPPNFPFYCEAHNQSESRVTIGCTSERVSSTDGKGGGAQKAEEAEEAEDRDASHHHHHQSHPPSSQTIFVYPATLYVAEVFDKYGHLTSNQTVWPKRSSSSNSQHLKLFNLSESSPPSTSFMFDVEHLQESSHYKIKIYAQNSKGKSDQVWISTQTLRKAEKYVYGNNSELGLLAFSSGPLAQLKLVALSLATFLLVVLVVIVVSITYMSRLCQLIGRGQHDDHNHENDDKKSEDRGQDNMTMVDGDDDSRLIGNPAMVAAPNYALQELGIHTMYTETSDAVCAEYYNTLMAQYDSIKDTGHHHHHHHLDATPELLSLDLYSMNTCKGPPDLIPTFYYAHTGGSTSASVSDAGGGAAHVSDNM